MITHIKMSKDSSAKYYQDKKERLEKKAHERYKSLSKEEKEKKQVYDNKQYKNLPKDKKHRLDEYRKLHKKKL